LILIPAASAVVHYDTSNYRDDYVAGYYARDILEPLPRNALLLMRSDENSTAVSYAQYAEHRRPDVVALDAELLKLPSYVEQKLREHPGLVIPFAQYDGGVNAKLADLVEANLGKRAVYTIGKMDEKGFTSASRACSGITTRLFHRHGVRQNRPFASRRDGSGSALPETVVSALDGSTPLPRTMPEPPRARPGLQTREPRPTRSAEQSIGRQSGRGRRSSVRVQEPRLILNEQGGHNEEVIRLWERFLMLEPSDPQAGAIRAVLDRLQAQR
jgi:hypothetical protein